MRRRCATGGMALIFLVLVSAAWSDASREPLRVRNEATFQALWKAAEEPNRDIRARAAWLLGATERKETRPVLLRLAQDPAPSVRVAALRALCRVLDPGEEAKVLLDAPVADPELRRAALFAAAHFRFAQREGLLRAALAGPSVVERAEAVRALGLDVPASARPLLQIALKDASAVVRAEAVRVIGKADDAEAMSLLMAASAERDGTDAFLVRAAACEALAGRPTEAARGALDKGIRDEHFLVRRAAVRAVAARKDAALAPAVQARVRDEDATVREAACAALGEIVVPDAAGDLAERLADGVVEVRDAAQGALRKLPADSSWAAVLRQSGSGVRAETRRRAWTLLGEYGHESTREAAFRALDDKDAAVAGNALRILRKLEDRRIIPTIKKFLKEPRPTESAPSDLQIEEAFRAAVLFDMRDGISFAMLCLVRTHSPPMNPDAFIPTEHAVIWSSHYLAAMKHKPAEAHLRKILEGSAAGNPALVDAVGDALDALTGAKNPRPAVPPPPEVRDSVFLEIAD